MPDTCFRQAVSAYSFTTATMFLQTIPDEHLRFSPKPMSSVPSFNFVRIIFSLGLKRTASATAHATLTQAQKHKKTALLSQSGDVSILT